MWMTPTGSRRSLIFTSLPRNFNKKTQRSTVVFFPMQLFKLYSFESCRYVAECAPFTGHTKRHCGKALNTWQQIRHLNHLIEKMAKDVLQHVHHLSDIICHSQYYQKVLYERVETLFFLSAFLLQCNVICIIHSHWGNSLYMCVCVYVCHLKLLQFPISPLECAIFSCVF